MTVKEQPEASPANGEAKTRRRSNRPYPPTSFEEAVKFANEIFVFSSGHPVRKLSYFDQVGRSPDSSSSRDAITNANKYGLLKSSFRSDMLELTDDGLLVVGDGTPAREKAKAQVRLAVSSIAPFSQLYERFAGNRLPARTVVADAMKEVGVPLDGVEEAVDLFILNLRFVGLLKVLAGAERIVTLDQLLDDLPRSTDRQVNSWSRQSELPQESGLGAAAEPRSLMTQEHANFETTCFYITPIGSADSSARKHSDLFLGSIIEPAITPLGLKVVRADAIDKPELITRQVIEYVLRSRLVIADLSFHNPNVFYELALRHAIRLPIVQIVRAADHIPFDINQMRTVQIDDADIYSFVPKLESYRSDVAAQARRALDSEAALDTPISIYFPGMKVSFS